MNSSQQIVAKLWSYCDLLRDDGLSYGDYVEQLTFLLFLKMAHERTQPPLSQKSIVPREYAWPTLLSKDGDALEVHYRHLLEALLVRHRAVVRDARERASEARAEAEILLGLGDGTPEGITGQHVTEGARLGDPVD